MKKNIEKQGIKIPNNHLEKASGGLNPTGKKALIQLTPNEAAYQQVQLTPNEIAYNDNPGFVPLDD